MRWPYFCVLVLFLASGMGMTGSEAQAVDFSLSSTENLTALPLNTDVWFQIKISGLSGQKLNLVGATVTYSGPTLDTFSIEPGIEPGGIVPTSGVEAGYFVVPDEPGNTEVSPAYMVPDPPTGSESDCIVSDGVFAKFKTQVHTPGSTGTFQFKVNEFYAYELMPDGTTNTPQPGIEEGHGSLTFHTANTPEPAAWTLLAAAAATLGPYYLLKRRKSRFALTR